MYGWIWRRLPFGVTGKLIGFLVLVVAAGALLWYVVFPLVDEHLPVGDGRVGTGTVAPAPPPTASGYPEPSGHPEPRGPSG